MKRFSILKAHGSIWRKIGLLFACVCCLVIIFYKFIYDEIEHEADSIYQEITTNPKYNLSAFQYPFNFRYSNSTNVNFIYGYELRDKLFFYSTEEAVYVNDNNKLTKTKEQFVPSSSVTVVAMYFELAISKHSSKEYDEWIRAMSESVTEAPLAIVCDPNTFEKMKTYRQHANNKSSLPVNIRTATNKLNSRKQETYTKFYVIDSVWSIMKRNFDSISSKLFCLS